MMSLRIFISPVVEGLRTSNLKSRCISLKGFHTALQHRVNVALLGDNHVILRNLHISSYGGASVIKFEQDVHSLDRRPKGTSPEKIVTTLPYDYVIQLWRV